MSQCPPRCQEPNSANWFGLTKFTSACLFLINSAVPSRERVPEKHIIAGQKSWDLLGFYLVRKDQEGGASQSPTWELRLLTNQGPLVQLVSLEWEPAVALSRCASELLMCFTSSLRASEGEMRVCLGMPSAMVRFLQTRHAKETGNGAWTRHTGDWLACVDLMYVCWQ